MRSVVYDRFAPASEVLELGERPAPVAGKGEILVRMTLSPIHNHDLMIIAGKYGSKPDLPSVPGTEAVGVIEALGEGVDHLNVGQRITANAAGTWAEFFVVDAKRAIPLPDSIDDATACQLIAMPLSTKTLLAELHVQAGQWIIQNAANGAVGTLLARFAREAGVNVIGLVRREQTIAELASDGIDNIVSTGTPGWQDRVLALTGGQPIVRALDSVGGDATDQLLDVMAENGELVLFGGLSGKPMTLGTANLLFKQQTVRGFWGAKPHGTPETAARMIGEIITAAANGTLKLPVSQVFSLADAAAAAKASDEPGRKGKVALRP